MVFPVAVLLFDERRPAIICGCAGRLSESRTDYKNNLPNRTLDFNHWYLSNIMSQPEHLRVTYNEVHNIIKTSASKIAEWEPNLLIAIGMCSCYQQLLGFETLLSCTRTHISQIYYIGGGLVKHFSDILRM